MKNGTCPSRGASSVYTSEQGIIYTGKGVHTQSLAEALLAAELHHSATRLLGLVGFPRVRGAAGAPLNCQPIPGK
jgi:hypothetical protein